MFLKNDDAKKKTMFGKHQVGQKLAMTSDRLNLAFLMNGNIFLVY